jgi:ribosomal protein S17E
MKLEKIFAVAGTILLLVVTVAIINTYTDLFKDTFKEDKQAASVEEKPQSKPKPKDGKMDFSREGTGKKVSGGSRGNTEQDNEKTPAMKFVKEVHKEYPELLKVRADFEQGGKCIALLLMDDLTIAEWRSNRNRLVRSLTSIRDKAASYSESEKCVVEVMVEGNTLIRAAPQGEQTKVTLFKAPKKEKL